MANYVLVPCVYRPQLNNHNNSYYLLSISYVSGIMFTAIHVLGNLFSEQTYERDPIIILILNTKKKGLSNL